MNHEIPDVQAEFRKGRGTRDQIANICCIIENAREFQKNTYFCFTDYAKVFDCVSQQTVANSSRDGNTRPPYLPPAGQEATVRTTEWFKIGKGVCQGCILSPCLFNLYTKCTKQNAWLDEAQTGIKIARRNVNNLRYENDTTLMTERKEELKSLLMKVKEEREKSGLKLNIEKLRSWHLVPSFHGK